MLSILNYFQIQITMERGRYCDVFLGAGTEGVRYILVIARVGKSGKKSYFGLRLWREIYLAH